MEVGDMSRRGLGLQPRGLRTNGHVAEKFRRQLLVLFATVHT